MSHFRALIRFAHCLPRLFGYPVDFSASSSDGKKQLEETISRLETSWIIVNWKTIQPKRWWSTLSYITMGSIFHFCQERSSRRRSFEKPAAWQKRIFKCGIVLDCDAEKWTFLCRLWRKLDSCVIHLAWYEFCNRLTRDVTQKMSVFVLNVWFKVLARGLHACYYP